MKKVILLPILFMLLIATDSFAAKRYWITSAAAYWNNTANWSSTSGGAGGSSVPSTNDTAYFDGNGLGNDTITSNITPKRIQISSGFTGKIVQQSGKTITVGSGGWIMSGGTFVASSSAISITGNLNNSGGDFTSTSGTMTLYGDYTLTGTGIFRHNNGVVTFNYSSSTGSPSTITISTSSSTKELYQLSFSTNNNKSWTVSSGTTIVVNNTFSFGGSGIKSINTGTIAAKGDISCGGSGSMGGSAILRANGTTNQTLAGGSYNSGSTNFLNFVIDKASDTLFVTGYVNTSGDFTRTQGKVSFGTSVLAFVNYGTPNITGTFTGFNSISKLWIITANGNYTVTVDDTINVNDSFRVVNNSSRVVGIYKGTGAGIVNVKGYCSVSGPTAGGGGSGTLIFCGTSNQTFSGGSSTTTNYLCNVIINKSAGTLTLANSFVANTSWTYSSTAGTLDAGTSTVLFRNTKTITGTHRLYNVGFAGDGNYTYTIASGTTLTVSGNLTCSGASNIILNTGALHVEGNITTTNTSTSTGGTAIITINGSGNQTITGSGTAGSGKFPNITIDKTGGSVTLASVISVTGNWNYIKGDVDPSNSTVALYGSFNLDGQQESGSACMRFYNLTLGGNTRTLTGNLDVNNNLTISTGTTLSAAAYTINVGGNWNSQGTWTYSTSTVVFDGSSYNTIQGASGAVVNFATVTVNRGAGSVTLLNPMKVNTAMTLTKGRIKTTSTNYLEFADNATCAGGDDAAYVHGSVRKTGNDAFTFPLGDTTLQDTASYHPLRISAPTNITDQYEAEYRNANQTQGSTLVDSLTALRGSEFWNLNRTPGSSAVIVTLSWNKNLPPSSISDLRVASWNATTSAWADLGQATVTLNWPTGTISAGSTTIFNTNTAVLTTASTIPKNWGYATLRRKLDGGFYEAKSNALYFRFDDEYNDQNHNLSYSIFNAANTNVAPTLVGSSNNAALSNYGDNRFKLDLWTNTASLSSGYYILEVRNEKEELFYLRFKKS